MLVNFETELQQLIALAFAEDGDRDVTTDGLSVGSDEREAVIVAKQNGIVCGMNSIDRILKAQSDALVFEAFLDEGDQIKERMMLGALTGPVSALLRVERVLVNFLSRLSGIATLTQQFVKELEGTNVLILDTRKTVPGWRYLDKYAVTVGGGINHRMGLHDVALLKDTHVDYVGGVGRAIERFRSHDEKTHLIVEVRNLSELEEVIPHAKSLTRVLLDNFSVDDLQKAVKMTGGKMVLEASGGITLENVREIAETGIHFVSIGSLTNSVQAFDFSFQISPE